MKKIIATALLAFLVPALAKAQEPSFPRHEIRVGTGFLPTDTDNVCDMSGSYASDYYYRIFGGEYIQGSDPGRIIDESRYFLGGLRSTWAFSVGYFYSVYKWLHVGATVSYHNVSREKFETVTRRSVSKMHRNYLSVIPTVRFSYLNRPHVRLYTAIGVGYCAAMVRDFDRRRSSESFTAYDITFFGISAGGRLFGSAEVGMYTAGYIKMAIGYRF